MVIETNVADSKIVELLLTTPNYEHSFGRTIQFITLGSKEE